MSKGNVVVLGLNGHIGHAVAVAFRDAGWEVTGMARSDKHRTPGIRYVQGDSDSVEDMRRAIGDAEIVVNALNMPYDKWFEGRMEAQMARVLEAMGTSGKTMLFPGNIYNFAATDRVVTPDLPQRPQTVRGELRVRVEQQFEAAAARGDIQALIIRAGDFYGPGSSNDWFDQVVFTGIKKGVVKTMGKPGVPHAWAYLPDLGRAFEALASVRKSLRAFDSFHFAGNFVTGDEMGAAIAKAAPGPVKLSAFPMWQLRAFGLVDPVVREVGKMLYIWENPMELRDERLDEILGEGFNTPFEQAVAAAAAPYLGRMQATKGAVGVVLA
ncbi:MAG: NAD-dependent epimerase/dehydratase family protein [Devosia sp.]